jgi:hypothetical protein
MLGLLVEFVRDARSECQRDIKRGDFLSGLLVELGKLSDGLPQMSSKKAASRLRSIYNSISLEFQNDPVTVHVKDCIQEFDSR